ncbi:NPCBM/NEW2 domain-containing protein [Caldicellulosiruptor acetigenus]|uniref:NPCBM/NEW2 domain-containing protein n=1 Tax=Caldicellulosiruptor acetigenus TaxID=301953 RepID=UPI000425203E|nr:NPCBM/NEW2 domain-containing protein [Caldicellulosiruptor acetigenus]WAM36194.1 NPCBM/NEW2 domain-containing protein [Caldicellulosiruptor acetigenus]
MKKRLLAFLSFVILISFALGVVASSPTNYKVLYEKLLKDYNVLKSENQKLKNEVTTLKKKTDDLQKKVTSLPQLSYYDIVVNGVPTAQKVPFISYGGRRYVHFDSMLKTFLNVGDTGYIFNDQTKRVEIGAFVKNKNGVWLSDLEYFDREGSYNGFGFNATDIVVNGKKFYKNIWWKFHGWKGYKFNLTYKLHGKYKKLQFKYGIDDDSDKGIQAAVRVYGDNEILGEFKTELYDDPGLASIDLTGVNYLTLEFETLTNSSGGYNCIITICDPLLIP